MNDLKRQIEETFEALVKATAVPIQSLGLDLDGTIEENPRFFGILSRIWPGKVYVISMRIDRAKAIIDLEAFGIRYDELVIVNSFGEKKEVVARLGIGVYIDDQDEVLMHMPESVMILKIRNGGNYDFDEKKWLYSKATGRPV